MSGLKAMLALLLWAPGFAAAQMFGYAVNSDDQTNADNLLRVNLTTGDIQFVGPLPSALEDVEGLAFSPSGTLYAVDNATNSSGRTIGSACASNSVSFDGTSSASSARLSGLSSRVPASGPTSRTNRRARWPPMANFACSVFSAFHTGRSRT